MAANRAISTSRFTTEQEILIASHPLETSRKACRSTLEAVSLETIDAAWPAMPFACSQILFILGVSDAATNICLKENQTISELLRKMIEKWAGNSCPAELHSLVKTAASDEPDLAVWTALVDLLLAFHSPSHSRDRLPETLSNAGQRSILQHLYKSWTGEYHNPSLHVLNGVLEAANAKFLPRQRTYYAKTLLFLQSSGMDKSRLVDKFGETCPMINFVLRERGARAYPAPDGEILDFMTRKIKVKERRKILESPKRENIGSKANETAPTPKGQSSRGGPFSEFGLGYDSEPVNEQFHEELVKVIWNHSRAAALLQASFEKFLEWAEHPNRTDSSLEHLAMLRHQETAPPEPSGWYTRSDSRVAFCSSVVMRAEKLSNGLIKSRGWRHAFRDDRQSPVRLYLENSSALRHLELAAEGLIRNLQARTGAEKDPILVVSLDEISSLLTPEEHIDPGLYHALLRIISCLRHLPIWFFLMSTESATRTLMPPADEALLESHSAHPTSRMTEPMALPGSLRHCPPFLALPLDIEDRRIMSDHADSVNALAKPLDTFSTVRHMAMFGRPLWFGYKDEDIIPLAKSKLTGGLPGTSDDYDPTNKDHVFAALSFRLSLDVCLQNPRSLKFQRTAVNSFMRVVIGMEPESGLIETIAPSEPILSQAALEYLCHKANRSSSC